VGNREADTSNQGLNPRVADSKQPTGLMSIFDPKRTLAPHKISSFSLAGRSYGSPRMDELA